LNKRKKIVKEVISGQKLILKHPSLVDDEDGKTRLKEGGVAAL
jgi:hypothetical protein